jgi:hypothetical protein
MAIGLGSGPLVAAETFPVAAVAEVASAERLVVTGVVTSAAGRVDTSGAERVVDGVGAAAGKAAARFDELAAVAVRGARAECPPAAEFRGAECADGDDAELDDVSAAAAPAPERIAAPIPSAAIAPPVHPAHTAGV